MGVCAKLARVSNYNWTPLSNAQLDINFTLMKEAGVRWIRDDWIISKFTSDGITYNFSVYDNIVDKALSYGFKIVALVDQFDYYTPIYAQIPGYTTANKLISSEAYGNWCTAIAEHFDGRISVWELGNEQNGNTFWANQPPSAANYTDWYLKPGYTAIKGVNSENIVLTGGLSRDGWGGGDGPGPCDVYLSKMYTAGAHGYFDGLAIHPYTRPLSPDFARLDECKAVMDTYGDGDLPIYITELGWPSAGSGSVPEEIQAVYLKQIYEMVLYGGYQNVPFICWYDFKDDGVSSSDAESNYGMIHNEAHPLPYSKKPAYDAFKEFATSLISPFPTFRRGV